MLIALILLMKQLRFETTFSRHIETVGLEAYVIYVDTITVLTQMGDLNMIYESLINNLV